MVWLLLLTAAAEKPGTLVTEAHGVRLCTQARASLYAYEITNLANEPITEFQVPYDDGYDFTVPAGWDAIPSNGMFHACVGPQGQAIAAGQSATFSFRSTSRGAVLGHVQAHVMTATGESIILPTTWGAKHMPRGYILLVAGIVLIIAAAHVALLSRRAARDG